MTPPFSYVLLVLGICCAILGCLGGALIEYRRGKAHSALFWCALAVALLWSMRFLPGAVAP